MPVLEIRQLKKAFPAADRTVRPIIDIPEFALESETEAALRGASGCGKTTFLNLIAGLVPADHGSIRLEGQNLAALSEAGRDRLRAARIGYIFQTFNLLQGFTCLENVVLGMSFGRKPDWNRARSLLQRMDLGNRIDYLPRQLSTGQQQRVATARALASRPRLVLADEPTGNLDAANARAVLSLIRECCRENGAALLLTSHDPAVLAQFDTPQEFSEINRSPTEGGDP